MAVRKKVAKQRSNRYAKKTTDAAATKLCELPDVTPREFSPDVGPERASLIRNSDKKWANGTKLHYHFLTSPSSWVGSAADKRKARDGIDKLTHSATTKWECRLTFADNIRS